MLLFVWLSFVGLLATLRIIVVLSANFVDASVFEFTPTTFS